MNTTCRSCGAKVLWAKTASGRSMPLDPVPSLRGNILLLEDGRAEVLSTPKRDEYQAEAAAGHVTLYLSHFATCPAAASHRKAKVKA